MAVNCLRWRSRHHTPKTKPAATNPTAAPSMKPAETQVLTVPDTHSPAAPTALANTINPVVSFIGGRTCIISLKTHTVGPCHVCHTPNWMNNDAWVFT